jgi:poly(ADP-ribose) glycohydrolase ARH3
VAVRFASDQPTLVHAARRSAGVTHAHPVGIDAATVQAVAVAAALRGEDFVSAAQAVASTPSLRRGLAAAADLLAERPAPSIVAATLGTGSTGHKSVPAAIYAAAAHASFADAVSFAVRLGGDTDTIGAMCGAIAGARAGADAIPAQWLAALEDGEKGRTHVESLADQLAR